MKHFHFIRGFALALCLLFAAGCTQAENHAPEVSEAVENNMPEVGQPVENYEPDVEEADEEYTPDAGHSDEEYAPEVGQPGKDVVWVPTPQALVDSMLDMAKVTSSDYVIDLGSGDGRLVITAAKRGATALGIEYNPDLVELARRAAMKEGVGARATFKKADIFESDFSQATVITLFLLSSLNLQLRPTILDMKPGTRVVSNSFDMGEWEPDQTKTLEEPSAWHTAHLWIVPAKVDGTWKLDDGQISFVQTFQNVAGTMTIGGEIMELTGKLDGDRISFNAGGREYVGTVSGGTISGTYDGGSSWTATR
ncbi:MAG: methyltransferase domain-containing protein [Betaproteobacteria bacterium]|nr:methyltransferase domain-containing protein [Betaproteobacteria bacterium]